MKGLGGSINPTRCADEGSRDGVTTAKHATQTPVRSLIAGPALALPRKQSQCLKAEGTASLAEVASAKLHVPPKPINS